MSGYDYSVTLIIPNALRDDANRLACAMGWDAAPLPGRTFSLPLSPDGSEPATHWLCRFNASAAFVGTLQAAQGGAVPTDPPAGGVWSDYGLTLETVAVAIDAIEADIIAATPEGGAAHWQGVISARDPVLAPVVTAL